MVLAPRNASIDAEWSQPGSNRRPPRCQRGALPAELWPLGRDTVAHRSRGGLAPARSGGDFDRGHVAPQILEAVIVPRLLREDVEDDVEVVGEDPGRLALAVDVARDDAALLLQLLPHLVVDRLRLARVAARADDEIVGVRAHRTHVEDDNVPRELSLREIGDAPSFLERRQRLLFSLRTWAQRSSPRRCRLLLIDTTRARRRARPPGAARAGRSARCGP